MKLQKFRLKVHEVKPLRSEHSFFVSIAAQLFLVHKIDKDITKDSGAALEIRNKAISWLKSHENIILSNGERLRDSWGDIWDEKINRLGQENTMGDDAVLTAIANAYDVIIAIIYSDEGAAEVLVEPEDKSSTTPVIFIGCLQAIDYYSLIAATQSSPKASVAQEEEEERAKEKGKSDSNGKEGKQEIPTKSYNV